MTPEVRARLALRHGRPARAGGPLTPEDIRARLARLREAGAALRRRPAHETLDALARVLETWRDPGSGPRRRLLRELPKATGFAEGTLALGLELGLADWTGDALHALVADELGGPKRRGGAGPALVSGFDTTAVILAGSLPLPTLLALVAPLALRSPVLAKSAARDPVTPRAIARSIAEIDPELGDCIDVVEFPGSDPARSAALLEADCIVATGSDETIAAVRARVAPPRRLVAHGHRVSVAVIAAGATSDPTLAERLALDVALWDQLGCLSPICVYVVGSGEAAADRLAETLHHSLGEIARRAPRGEMPPAAAAVVARERAVAELRAAAGQRVALKAGATHTVVREGDARLRPAPLHRFVRVHPVPDPAALCAALAPLGPHLAGVALEGFAGDEATALARSLAALGASRVCRAGELQRPPLAWPRGGQPVLFSLARLAPGRRTRPDGTPDVDTLR